MKALILAAGYGTRLRPHTEHIPKPLFPIAGQPLIDLTIRRLIDMGITGIVINVHHLHQQITSFILSRNYPIEVFTRYEEKILGTGGAIKNVSDFLDDQPFLVINSDILTDIDILSVRTFHQQHHHPATLVMHDYPTFNNVWVDENENIIEFSDKEKNMPNGFSCQAFTGIQILDPLSMKFIPKNKFISIIDVYREMIKKGLTIKAYTLKNHYWRDIGTPESFTEAVYDKIVPAAFATAFAQENQGLFDRTLLAGDGSDRRWYRISSNSRCMIMADHGINSENQTAEVDSFIKIGEHLFKNKIPVPEIFHSDSFSGQVYVQDLGDINFQAVIQEEANDKNIIRLYQQVIDQALCMSVIGAESFDLSWTFQTKEYDRQLILDKECRYFVDAFLNNYLKIDASYADFETEFDCLADHALENAVTGFMHRDLQSRNIMVSDGKIFFIDFQGARLGPIQYDLASLLTDPYVNLPESTQEILLDYSADRLGQLISIDKPKFILGYRYCSITRILQSLGAFGYLSKIKNKPFFEQFIPIALKNLHERLKSPEMNQFHLLTETVKNALISLDSKH
ncbi:MAG: phosphotransferase [Desulfobacteraceae bacterium]|nr:phosphotransferase [Desulfobacteraceae bacterium]MBC2754727.1 phosphotransferase [Desulfobacteraceae bacterium]